MREIPPVDWERAIALELQTKSTDCLAAACTASVADGESCVTVNNKGVVVLLRPERWKCGAALS